MPVAVVTGMTSAMSVANGARSSMLARSCSEDTLLERLAQDLQDMAVELWQFIQEEHPLMGQRHVARHRHMASADQPHFRDGMVGGTTTGGS